MKRILPVIVSVTMLVALLPCITVSAKVYGDLQYEVRDGYVEITDCENVAAVEIPAQLDDLPVTSIGSEAFFGLSNLTNIYIPDSVTSIGRRAFYGCTNLISMDLPSSVSSIGNAAFFNCKNWRNINIPNSVVNIGYNAFAGTPYYNNLENWEDGFLYLNNWLVDSDGISDISNYAIKPGTRGIASSVFNGCENLTNLIISDGVVYIGDSAFSGCANLSSINIPESVTRIGYNAFSSCKNLSNLYITNLEAYLNIEFCIVDYDYYADAVPFAANGNAHKLYINGELATDITIPDGATNIPAYAFSRCKDLTTISTPSGVKGIGKCAFLGCSNLTTVTISNGMTIIGNDAFYDCKMLINISIPGSITNIGASAFWGCYNLSNLYITDLAAYLNIKYDGDYYGSIPFSNNIAHKLYINGKLATDITIPDSVTNIYECAFYGCIDLTNITIPRSVTNIGEYAFCNCSKLTNLIIPDSVMNIGDCAFMQCSGLTNVKIGGGITNIGENMFTNCTKLTNIEIPAGVRTILANAFRNCTSLSNVYYTGTESQWNSIIIASGNGNLTRASIHYKSSIPDSAFTDMSGYPYVINDVSLKATDGSVLTEVPNGSDFIVNVNFKKIMSREKADYIFVAVYDTSGALLSLDYLQTTFIMDNNFNTGFYVQPQTKKIGSVKVYVWSSFNDATPLANSVELKF